MLLEIGVNQVRIIDPVNEKVRSRYLIFADNLEIDPTNTNSITRKLSISKE